MNDIDLSQTAPGGEWDFGNGWKPVEEFYGTFDGNGYRIMNMTIYGTTDKETFFGLFGTLRGEHVTIRNPGLVNVSIDISNTSGHSRLNIGGIAGGGGPVKAAGRPFPDVLLPEPYQARALRLEILAALWDIVNMWKSETAIQMWIFPQ